MKEHLIIMGAAVETQHRLAVSMHASFTGGPLEYVSVQYVATQRAALTDFTFLKAIYLDHVLHPTNELLRTSMPEINELLEKRGSLKLDYDSYARRAKTETDKDPNSAASSKLVIKRDNAKKKLSEITQSVRDHLDDLERRRPSMLVSELSALVGIQQASTAKFERSLAELLPALPHAAVTICALAHAVGSSNAENHPPP
mmetsp:Transcript_33638/g.68764  ORF Transcript_33638/g.68764 Transcript_33638/m.68764 type:complete len:200 (+) Transcript_33638:142-741(+)